MNSSKRRTCVCKTVDKLAQAASLALALMAAPASAAPPPADPAFVPMTRLQDIELPEISGLAASRRWPGVYWTHNDSGGTPTLYAFNRRGQVLARIPVAGADAVDWEDLALYERDGRSWLAIADTGDNFAWRPTVTIYLLPEPELDASQAEVSTRIDFRYPDGPRDAEALAVDAEAGQLLVLEKGAPTVGLYALPLQAAEGIVEARRIADLTLPWPGAPVPAAPVSAARGRVTVTAMDLSRDGRHLAVMTYVNLYRYERAPGQDWVQVLAQPPRHWRLPHQGGLEAMAIEPDGVSVVLAPEGSPAPVFRAKGILAP